ncbi:MAG: LLM class flavin-dependent oxidoreductase [Deltaproteobacteria bacterium]|nr:LLM class flavin-dependent oxidoreductase [Deltaproteobacteria bacterium]
MVSLSILDLAFVGPGQTAGDAFAGSVALAQLAERLGYTRVWYAEHHNIPSIASSATSVVIAHIAAQTTRIRIGAGGIMLPNHTPLQIAEQFGTLESLHPGRIDLALGRAPGTDQTTLRALRRTPHAADSFPQDVVELQAFLGDEPPFPGVIAIPGKGAHVPLYMLGSSLFGAQLAATLGLPFAFASNFAPGALEEAVALYRRTFKPSAQLAHPYVIAGVNVVAADDAADAAAQFASVRRARVRALLGRGRALTDADVDGLLESPEGRHLQSMARYSAVGTAAEVRDYLAKFARHADADELITVHPSPTLEARLRSVELTATALPHGGAATPAD